MINAEKNKKLWIILGLGLFALIIFIWAFEKGELIGVALAK